MSVPGSSDTRGLGWHVIAGDHLLECLRRQAGEDADMVFAELWANAEHTKEDDDE